MAVTFEYWGSTTMPDDDTTTNIGGAKDSTKRVYFVDIDPDGTVQMHSTSASDTTQTVTIYYVDPLGGLSSESQLLSGTTWVNFTATMRTIRKVVVSAALVGSLEVRETVSTDVIITIAPGVLEMRRICYDLTTPVSGTIDYYDKFFVVNVGADTATNPQASEYSDAQDIMTFGLDIAINDSKTNGVGNNRTVAPSGITFDGTAKSVPGGHLAANDGIGVWVKMTLESTKLKAESSWGLQMDIQAF